MDNIFVVVLALQVKVGKVASFVVKPSTTKTMNILPHENYPLYGIRVTIIPPTHIYTGVWDALSSRVQ